MGGVLAIDPFAHARSATRLRDIHGDAYSSARCRVDGHGGSSMSHWGPPRWRFGRRRVAAWSLRVACEAGLTRHAARRRPLTSVGTSARQVAVGSPRPAAPADRGHNRARLTPHRRTGPGRGRFAFWAAAGGGERMAMTLLGGSDGARGSRLPVARRAGRRGASVFSGATHLGASAALPRAASRAPRTERQTTRSTSASEPVAES